MSRLTKEEALDLIQNADLKDLGIMASKVKKDKHPKGITTFVIDRNINYTNICWVDCKFCAFYRHEKDEDAYVLTFEEIDEKIDELLEIGGTQILFQGGVHPKLKIEWYENLVEHIHSKYPELTIHGFSSIELDYIARISKISIKEVLTRLKAKGLASIPGAGAEILNDEVRDLIAPRKIDTSVWLDVHEVAHSLGIKSTATMMYGTLESDEQIIEHFDVVRELQDKTGGFRAFIMWSFQGENTQLLAEHPEIKKQSASRYLRLLAVARLYLDNFDNIQSSWVTQGAYIGQLALKFGANDLGSTMMEENVVKSAGASFRLASDELIELIKGVGEIAAIRNTAYKTLKVCK
ncbi:MAG: dehypoxanthine futalosine cyclase [Helicobacteraceae bacterium]|nr:dehypoxanthine futalosine cyclase [Helicobacteraceae bacterium]